MHATLPDRSFEINLSSCRKRLFEQALHLTRGRSADAEDLVQETLLRAYQWRGSFRQSESLGPWLRAILFHTFVNDYRRRRRRPQVLLSDLPDNSRRRIEENMPDPAYSRDASERSLMVREQADAALAALDRLSTPLRDALYLSLVEELSYAQISERLSIPMGHGSLALIPWQGAAGASCVRLSDAVGVVAEARAALTGLFDTCLWHGYTECIEFAAGGAGSVEAFRTSRLRDANLRQPQHLNRIIPA